MRTKVTFLDGKDTFGKMNSGIFAVIFAVISGVMSGISSFSITVDDFFDLLEVVQAEVTSGFHLSEKDLQDTGLAVRLLFDRTAPPLKLHFPNDHAKQDLSKGIDIIKKFKVLRS